MQLDPVTTSVQKMYERYPYPHYPILAKPRWQDGYLGLSLFSARLLAANRQRAPAIWQPRQAPRILCAGCGEIQPYILRQLEPWRHRLIGVDLSERSLLRARLRMLASLAGFTLVQSDINAFLQATKESFHHVDAFGFFHHLVDPEGTLGHLAKRMEPNATLRMMVYNSPARTWIHQVQDEFRALGLSHHKRDDVHRARTILWDKSKTNQGLEGRLAAMGQGTLANDARFVDTFMHAHENRAPIGEWFHMLQKKRFVPFALFDRYAELDVLPNPLWTVPDADTLMRLAQDGQFAGNLELYLSAERTLTTLDGPVYKTFVPHEYRLVGPPRLWFAYAETARASIFTKMRLWHHHVQHVFAGKSCNAFIDGLRRKYSIAFLQRLARVGAILPGMVESTHLRDVLRGPLL